MDFFNCKSLHEAQEIIKECLAGISLDSEMLSLQEARGRIAAEDIIAQENIPPFNRSTVDGYAVRSGDTFGAGEANPVWLTIQGEVYMGQAPGFQIAAGQAAIIPTGGMLPGGTDSVVMLEYTEADSGKKTVFVNKPAAPGENVIIKGEDISAGAVLVCKGQEITPQVIGALAACGISEIKAFSRVKAAVISTGDELVDITKQPAYGEVRDINSYTLAASLAEAGCIVNCTGIVRDTYQEVLQALQQVVSQYHMVIISGGSSVGVRDHTVKAIGALGSPGVLFHGLAVKPGKPTIFGMIGSALVFGLPGHPVSAMTIYDQIVLPALRLLAGRISEKPRACRAKLARNVASMPGRDDFIQVRLVKQGEEFVAEPILGKSGLISTLLRADGVVRVDASKSGLYKDELVDVILT